jgi:LPXTG-motif cell wall-anchored protein
MTTGGTVVATVPALAATNGGGQGSAASTSTDNTVTWVPGPAPTVTIDQGAAQTDPTSASPIVFDVVFSQPVTGFTDIDVSFAGSTAGGTLAAAVSGSGATYSVSVTGMTTGGTIVASIPAFAAANAGGQGNTASTSTDNTVTWVPSTQSPTTATPETASAGATPPVGGLPSTGNSVGWLLAVSVALLAAGVGILLAVRRRRTTSDHPLG